MTRRVLIVDDSNAMRAFVRAALEDGLADVELVEAESGFEALRQLPRHAVDLAILDINMPHIHGLELIALLRRDERYRALPVLVISTESAQRDQQRALELGATAFLGKPFDAEQLLGRVHELLQSPVDGA